MIRTIEDFVTRVNTEIKADPAFGGDFYEENPEHITSLEISYGKKYAKLIAVSVGSRSAWGFVDMETLELFKSDGWSRPAKHSRGNIETATYGKNYTWTGPNYLR